VGQSVDVLKTNIINYLAFRGLCGTICENDGATLLSGSLMLKCQIPPQAMAKEFLMMFLRVSMLLSK
jgi:hypothetical protein